MVPDVNDGVMITLDQVCNSADPSVDQDSVDGLIRICIYYAERFFHAFYSNLKKKIIYCAKNPNQVFYFNPTNAVPDSQSYVAAGVKFTDNIIYLGQILIRSLHNLNLSSHPGSNAYGYAENSNAG